MADKLVGMLAATSCWLVAVSQSVATDHVVATTAELSAALAAAGEGDQILLQPGVFAGGHYRENLRDVTIRSVNPGDPAIIDGGGNAFQLVDAQRVTISDLVLRNQQGNGINIDDGGSFDTPSADITIRNVSVRDVQMSGNHDGIKMSGVSGFLIDGVQVQNWGNAGSGLDLVGCHHGLVQNSRFANADSTYSATAMQLKGGSKDITIRANRVELIPGLNRAIQAGGSTSAEFYRFIDGDWGYEADEIVAEGNVVVGGGGAFSWVNIDGGVYHHNVVYRPGSWVARILNENGGLPIVDTQNGIFDDNRIVYNDVANEFHSAVNVGPETAPETYVFARNKWLNLANPTPAGSTPSLPTPEVDGTYGGDPMADPDAAQVWDFSWGKWIVNTNSSEKSVELANVQNLRRATPSATAEFHPLNANPLSGTWTSAFLPMATIQVPEFTQLILIDPESCPNCISDVGDYDGNGTVELADYEVWRAAFGTANLAADGSGDSLVDTADYVVWRHALALNGNGAGSQAHSISLDIPEPTSILLGVFLCAVEVMLQRRRQETRHTGSSTFAR